MCGQPHKRKYRKMPHKEGGATVKIQPHWPAIRRLGWLAGGSIWTTWLSTWHRADLCLAVANSDDPQRERFWGAIARSSEPVAAGDSGEIDTSNRGEDACAVVSAACERREEHVGGVVSHRCVPDRGYLERGRVPGREIGWNPGCGQ